MATREELEAALFEAVAERDPTSPPPRPMNHLARGSQHAFA